MNSAHQQLSVLPYIFDLELSGKCNTVCSFCPRHEMLRGEQLMSAENFEFFFVRLAHYARVLENQLVYLPFEKTRAQLGARNQSALRVIMCGMGESLMHRSCAEWVARIRREIGIRVTVVTNGLLLKDRILEELLVADITVVLVSVPGIDKESYSRYMRIDWERVQSNLDRARSVLGERVQINATIPDDASYGPEEVQRFWENRGFPVAGINVCHNRGGHLNDNSLTGKHGMPSTNFCGILARHNFIAWDGRVLSCCHDLHADNVIGHVANDDFLTIAARKTPLISDGPGYKICANCNDSERAHAAQILASPLVQISGTAATRI